MTKQKVFNSVFLGMVLPKHVDDSILEKHQTQCSGVVSRVNKEFRTNFDGSVRNYGAMLQTVDFPKTHGRALEEEPRGGLILTERGDVLRVH